LPSFTNVYISESKALLEISKAAAQLGEGMKLDVKAFAVPRAEWPAAFEPFGIPKG
jgi:hypothetical protein